MVTKREKCYGIFSRLNIDTDNAIQYNDRKRKQRKKYHEILGKNDRDKNYLQIGDLRYV